MLELGPWQLVLTTPLGGPGRLAAVALTTGIAMVHARDLLRRYRAGTLAAGRGVLLLALRCAALLLALALVTQPSLMRPMLQRLPSHVVVLADLSRSMSLPASRPGADPTTTPSRARQLSELLRASGATVAAWQREHLVTTLGFARELMPSDLEHLRRGARATGEGTAIVGALTQLRGQVDGEELGAVVLLSDGIDTEDQLDEATDVTPRGVDGPVPIHTVLIGRTDLPDVAIDRVHADDFAFVRTVVSVDVDLRATGLTPSSAPPRIDLLRDGQTIASKPLLVDDRGAVLSRQRIRFSMTPERVGEAVYELFVPPAPEELTADNNRARFVLNVLRDKIRVLHVAGRPAWDVRFLRGLLEQTPNVDLISFFILRTLTDLQMAPTSELSLIPFPTRELFEDELGSFDVVILQNFEYGPYQMGPYLDRIRDFVEKRGGGLVMVGGDLSFSSGGYGATPLAEVLPVELLPSAQAPEQLVREGSFRAVLTAEGMAHPVMELRREPVANRAAWAALAPLDGVNLIARARPGAQVLATHPTERDLAGGPMPVIVAGDIGKGRSVAIATDSTWSWGFGAAGSGSGLDGRAYGRFWGNLFRWLTKDPRHELLRLELERRGADVTAKLSARDAAYRPAPGVPLHLTAVALPHPGRPGPREGATVWQSDLTTERDGSATIPLPTLTEGVYRLVAEGTLAGRPARDERAFAVDQRAMELARPVPCADRLRRLAQRSGGTFLDNPTSLDPLTIPPARRIPVGQRQGLELWSRSWALALALLALAAEWALRRRWGLR